MYGIVYSVPSWCTITPTEITLAWVAFRHFPFYNPGNETIKHRDASPANITLYNIWEIQDIQCCPFEACWVTCGRLVLFSALGGLKILAKGLHQVLLILRFVRRMLDTLRLQCLAEFGHNLDSPSDLCGQNNTIDVCI